MGDPLPAAQYIQILLQTGDKRQHTACVEMSVKGEQSTKQHPGKKVTGLYVCSGQKVSKTIGLESSAQTWWLVQLL